MFMRILIDIATGSPISDVELASPLVNQICAPFFDFPSYFLTLPHPEAQLLSWLAWLSAIWIIFALIRLKGPLKKKILPLARGMIAVTVSFALFIIYCLLFPLPQYRLESKNPDEVFLDLHSHTIYSHDGIATPERSFHWHLNHGFNGWATTEHDWIGDAPLIQQELIKKNSLAAVAIAGQEVNFKKAHLNLLGIKEDVDTARYKNLEDLIEEVHRQGGAVVVPHLWAETKSPFSMKDLSEAGVDAFEIAGNASIPLSQEAQQEIIALCREEGLIMVSGTNWHGWRNFCTVWTGFRAENWGQLDMAGRERAIIDALRNRETGSFRVIGYRQKFPASPVHYVFEPFTGLFSYFTSINKWQQLSWLFWAAIICFLLSRIKNKRLTVLFLWSVISLMLAVKSILVFNTWKTVADINKALPEVNKGLLLIAAVTICLALTNLKKHKN